MRNYLFYQNNSSLKKERDEFKVEIEKAKCNEGDEDDLPDDHLDF